MVFVQVTNEARYKYLFLHKLLFIKLVFNQPLSDFLIPPGLWVYKVRVLNRHIHM